jgi:hypothetical protein
VSSDEHFQLYSRDEHTELSPFLWALMLRVCNAIVALCRSWWMR